MATSQGVPGPDKAGAKRAAARVVDPIATGLLRIGLSPDAVTAIGAVGVVAASVGLYARGSLVVGSLVITAFALSDMLDGAMARISGRGGPWGAFLDSTLDRISDAAIFASLAYWYLRGGDDALLGALALYALIAGQIVSYARARAEGLGMNASGGIAERTERLFVVLLTTFLAGLGVPYVQAGGLWLLVVATSVTVVQRMLAVRRQTRGAGTEGGAA